MGGFMNMQKWSACHDDRATIESSYNKPIYLAMDLASKKDLCAVYGLWMLDDKIVINGHAYMPEEAIHSKDARLRSNFLAWEKKGLLTVTPGDITDYNVIKDDIVSWSKKSTVISIAYDPFQATMMVNDLSALGIKLVEIGQTVKNLSEPMKQLEADTLGSKLIHSNPLLTWAVSNLQVRRDKKENYFPGKESEQNRIDPAVACIMNYAQQLITPINKFSAKRKLRVWTT
jgi:phage terminase large subunit-like protein